MTDIVNPEIRSRMMAGIQGKNTKPELFIRKNLHHLGYRYRIHDTKLPGKPDMVLRKYNAIILINGCFWHGHDCHLFKWPRTRPEFWHVKITDTRERDEKNKTALIKLGWRVLEIWECALKGKTRLVPEDVIAQITVWLHSNINYVEIQGRKVNSE